MSIDWTAFLVVAVAVLAASVVLSLFTAGGLRLLEAEGRTSGAARAGAYACFAVCVAAVLFGLWVIVPQFH